jgi:hypothetical protein
MLVKSPSDSGSVEPNSAENCFSSAHIATEARRIAASGADRSPGGNNGARLIVGINRVAKVGLTTGTASGFIV